MADAKPAAPGSAVESSPAQQGQGRLSSRRQEMASPMACDSTADRAGLRRTVIGGATFQLALQPLQLIGPAMEPAGYRRGTRSG